MPGLGSAVDGKGSVGTITTHLTSHTEYCWLDCDFFVSYLSRDCKIMICSKKDRSYYSLSMRRDHHFIVAGDGRSSVGPRTTPLYSQKVDFGTDRSDVGFRTYQSHHTASPIESALLRAYSYNTTVASSFGIVDFGDKGGVNVSSIFLSSHKDDFWIDVSYFLVGIIPTLLITTDNGPIIYYLRGGTIILVLMVMV